MAIDGIEIPCVHRVTTVISADEAPMVRLDLGLGHDVTIKNGSICVNNVVMPSSVERALWKHLRLKYSGEIVVSTLGSRHR
ncbi:MULTISPECIES: hypothetical protein [unclassified Caballeronia]|uniref:hypothetical protein n=1 Tax=unclassified Caballeronia TaxID=2646786 RepID=UPI00286427E4|nr:MULTISPECIES: hypothetical protein [unclassified Caballeronia]MDR5775930.1 hypothetical protein [Caballeronia sp. LZ002]MDR5801481.1 hypothetical protein [Caballeronia sp. LZ001]MDR5851369.1 hypothetical protein [Caballeronia sp. LZ003]